MSDATTAPTLPNGKPALGLTCPHCQTAVRVEYPASHHLGQIKCECGACGEPFQYSSPHGTPAPEPEPAGYDAYASFGSLQPDLPSADVAQGDGGTASDVAR